MIMFERVVICGIHMTQYSFMSEGMQSLKIYKLTVFKSVYDSSTCVVAAELRPFKNNTQVSIMKFPFCKASTCLYVTDITQKSSCARDVKEWEVHSYNHSVL